MSDLSTLTAPYRVRSYEADHTGQCTLYSISNYLQETAGDHARKLHFDIGDLSQNNQTWVLQRLVIDIEDYPYWRDDIAIKTWPSGTDGLRAYRDFQLKSEEGEIWGTALSYWMVMDLESRRPVRLPESLIEHRAIVDKHVMPVSRDRLKFSIEDADFTDRYIIQPSDIDVNQHVNNAVYIRLIEDMLKRHTIKSKERLGSIDISYLREVYEGDEIVLKANRHKNQIQVSLQNTNNKELVKAELLLRSYE
jgi:medium-chain acyl-[acyl-carrier-protein] hydrolase